tara:strand:+ start:553 stop:732 length:180 start_codon:yes stop_codon:yes gene_type:complete
MIITKAKYRNTVMGADITHKDIVTTIDDTEMYVPIDPENRHYIAIQEWVAKGNTIEDAD